MVTFTEYNRRRRYPDWRDPPSRCDCCGDDLVTLASNSAIYGREYGDWPYVYLCMVCGAFVGCHPHSIYPLGTMTDNVTRSMRRALHAMVDPLWKSGARSRGEVYGLLARLMNFPRGRRFHVGELSREECLQANEAFRAWETAADFEDDPRQDGRPDIGGSH